MISKNLNPCPKCGGPPRIITSIENPWGKIMEIQCLNCGLTLCYNTDRAWTSSGTHIIIGSDITWRYGDKTYTSAIEVWNNAKGGIGNA